MSAYVVSDKHISAMLTMVNKTVHGSPMSYYWNDERINFMGNIQEIGQKLVDENYKSVNFRYDKDDAPHAFRFEPVGMEPIQVVRLCHAYNYQACEHKEWEASEAKEIADQIIDCAIRQVPGYEEAAWDI